jgi:hypothetical protein
MNALSRITTFPGNILAPSSARALQAYKASLRNGPTSPAQNNPYFPEQICFSYP